MLTKLSLINFKAFRNLNELEIKPLTVLCGTNSCGKSSILQGLLLLKQSMRVDPRKEALILDGPFVQASQLRELAFGLPQTGATSIGYTLQFSRETADGVARKLTMQFRQKRTKSRQGPLTTVVNRLSWTDDEGGERAIRLRKDKWQWPGIGAIEIKPPPNYAFHGEGSIGFENFMPQYLSIGLKPTGRLEHEKSSEAQIPVAMASKSLGQLLGDLRDELENLRYLGPIRARPQRAYAHYKSAHFDLEDDGSNAAHVFWTRRDQKVVFNNARKSLQSAVEEALDIMGLRQRIQPSRAASYIYQLKVSTLSHKKKAVTIADVGFGFSQVLPVILRGLLSPNRSIVMFEQPEIHLHPSCKGNLADLMLGFATKNRRILLETHSSELINKLRLRVVENPELASKINLVFVDPPSSSEVGSAFRQLQIDKDGMFNEWPEGFCDESEKIATAIVNARLSRGKKNG